MNDQGNLLDTTYYSDGEGGWVKRVWGEQCEEEVFLDQCQGLKGHDGDHWHYSLDGSYYWSRQRDDPRRGSAAAGMTPPGSKDWISPVDKAAEKYNEFYEDSDVIESELIERLERGELRDGETIIEPNIWMFNRSY